MTEDNLAQNQKQEKQEEDYFSFFSSTERILMKPEASFQGIRQHMEQLPTDFCLLFEDGYDKLEPGSMFNKSNYVFAVGLPILKQVETYFKNSIKVKQLVYKDLINCSDKQEVNSLLENTFTKDELKKHLGTRYG